jgi:RNA 3'-terminal phosphate cyclase
MPVEIRELYIKAVIDTGGGSKKNNNGQTAATGEADAGGEAGQSAEQLAELCVEKVLEILKEKQER